MKKETLLHIACVAVALGCSGFAVFQQPQRMEWEPMPPVTPLPAPKNVVDADGVAVPTGDYRRIVICSGGALLQQFTAIERIAAVDTATAEDPATAWNLGHCARIPSLRDTDAILSLNPDLVIANGSADREAVAKLRAAGCVVFELGEATTLAEVEKAYATLGSLLNVRLQTEKLIAILQRRARVLALHAPNNRSSTQQTVITAREPQRMLRLRAAFDLAGLSFSESSGPMVQLPANALADPLGGDLIEIATALRTQFDAEGHAP